MTLARSLTWLSMSFGVTSRSRPSPRGGSQQIGGQGGPVHHCGHPHRQHRHPQGGPVQRRPVVAHPGAGGNPRIGQLHRAAQPFQGPGGQGVHRHHTGRLQPAAHCLDQLAALHPCGAQHSGGQGGHRAKAPEVLWTALHQVPGDQGVVVDLGPQRVRCDGPVAQPHHQRQPASGDSLHQSGQLPGHRPGRPAEGPLLPPGQAVQGEGHIPPHRLAQGLFPPPVQNAHRLGVKALPLSRGGLHPLQHCGLRRPLLPDLLGLQGQVRSASKHLRRLLFRRSTPRLSLGIVSAPTEELCGRPGRPSDRAEKIRNFFKKGVAFFKG